MVHPYNPSTQEAEAGRVIQVGTRLSYVMRPCLKQTKVINGHRKKSHTGGTRVLRELQTTRSQIKQGPQGIDHRGTHPVNKQGFGGCRQRHLLVDDV